MAQRELSSLTAVRTVLHVSPHPDDEALGAPATLLLLQHAGWKIVNLLVSTGRSDDEARRRHEAVDAAARAGWDLALPDGRDLPERMIALVERHAPAVVVSPWPHEVHPRHEEVARATADVLASLPSPPVWWQWGLWADLRHPTLYVPFDDDVLADAHHVLAAYAGELARNDYARLLDARAIAHAVLGSERVFGFGSARASQLPYAELLNEQRFVEGGWQPGPARVLDPDHPLTA
jgi:LmbE family N-acetylglucosaminyl deacetylase